MVAMGPGMYGSGFAVSSGQLAGYTQVRSPSSDPDQIQIHMIVRSLLTQMSERLQKQMDANKIQEQETKLALSDLFL
eukprot:2591641-Amphidinium_carterae.1